MQIYIIFQRSPNLHFAPILQKLTVSHHLLLFLTLQKRRFLRALFWGWKSKCTKNIKAENYGVVYYVVSDESWEMRDEWWETTRMVSCSLYSVLYSHSLPARLRAVWSRMTLRMRIDLGVTSRYSSSLKFTRAAQRRIMMQNYEVHLRPTIPKNKDFAIAWTPQLTIYQYSKRKLYGFKGITNINT